MGNDSSSPTKPYVFESNDSGNAGTLRYTQFEAAGYGQFTCASDSPGAKPTLSQWVMELARTMLKFDDDQWAGDVQVVMKVTGPSGCGKSLIAKRLAKSCAKIFTCKIDMTSGLEESYKEMGLKKLFARLADDNEKKPDQVEDDDDDDDDSKHETREEHAEKKQEALPKIICESRDNHGTFFSNVQRSIACRAFRKYVDRVNEKPKISQICEIDQDLRGPRFNRLMVIEGSSKYDINGVLACLDDCMSKVIQADLASGKMVLLMLEMVLDPTCNVARIAPTASMGNCTLLPRCDATPQLILEVPPEPSSQELFVEKLAELKYKPDDVGPVSDEFAKLACELSSKSAKTVLNQVVSSRSVCGKRGAEEAQLEDRAKCGSSE